MSNFNRKVVAPKLRQNTSLPSETVSKLSSIESVSKSLSIGSKRNLNAYVKRLTRSKGVDKPEFDSPVERAMREYLMKPTQAKKMRAYLRNCKSESGVRFARNLREYRMIQQAIDRMLEPDHSSFRWNRNYQQALEELRNLLNFKIKPLKLMNDDDIINCLPKRDTHSGFQAILTGNRTKGENLEDIFKRYDEARRLAIEEGTFNKPQLIGFRTQCSGELTDSGEMTNTCKHKLRVVIMMDMFNIINERCFQKPLQQELVHLDFIGGGKNDDSLRLLFNHWRGMYSKFISIDYSSFDQTISSWLVEDVFRILKGCFILTQDESKLYDVMVHDFIHKDIILAEGVAKVHKCVPSGSMFTQIMDSLVNWVAIRTYFISKERWCKMNIMGDDNIIFCGPDILLEDMGSYIMKNFGLIIKTDDKTNEGDTRRDDPKYLSKFWRKDGCWRNPWQIYSRMLYPERHRQYGWIKTDQGPVLFTPYDVISSYIYAYPLGMRELIDVDRFNVDHPMQKEKLKLIGSRALSGYLAYKLEYED